LIVVTPPFYPETVETSKESPEPVISIKKIHEYIKRKVFECKQQDAEHESMYTDRFRSYPQPEINAKSTHGKRRQLQFNKTILPQWRHVWMESNL
jgi:transposase-like protein